MMGSWERASSPYPSHQGRPTKGLKLYRVGLQAKDRGVGDRPGEGDSGGKAHREKSLLPCVGT